MFDCILAPQSHLHMKHLEFTPGMFIPGLTACFDSDHFVTWKKYTVIVSDDPPPPPKLLNTRYFYLSSLMLLLYPYTNVWL